MSEVSFLMRQCDLRRVVGVDERGHRQAFGVSVSLSEREAHWRAFLLSLVERGLTGVQLVISDSDSGLKAARTAVLGGAPWQRRQLHLQQNAIKLRAQGGDESGDR